MKETSPVNVTIAVEFGRKFKLEVHFSSVHNTERPFKCDLCKKTFSTHQEQENHSHICPKLKLRARATSHNIDLTPPYLSVEA